MLPVGTVNLRELGREFDTGTESATTDICPPLMALHAFNPAAVSKQTIDKHAFEAWMEPRFYLV